MNPDCRVQDQLSTNRAVHYRPIIKSQKTAWSVVGVVLTTFRTAATDEDKD